MSSTESTSHRGESRAGSAEAPASRKEQQGAPAVHRAARVLRILADQPGRDIPLTELAELLDAAKSSTLAVCVALEEARLVRRSESGYQLGRTTVELGGAYLSGTDQLRDFYDLCAASPVLSHEVVQVALLDQAEVFYLARHEGRAPYRFAAGIGARFPASSTAVGLALLARLSDEEIRERFVDGRHFPRMTPYSITDMPGLLAAVERTRRHGYSVDREGVHPGIVAVGVPLQPWTSADVPLSMGASFLAAEATPERISAVAAELQRIAGELSNPMVRAQQR